MRRRTARRPPPSREPAVTSASSPASRRGPASDRPARRVRGVDAVRGLAVLGMVAVHVGNPTAADGSSSWEHLAFAGLASAVFVVVAGVSLALSWPSPGSAGLPTTDPHPRRTTRLLVRAGLLFLLGLLLGLLESPVAVILCHYGVLFALAPALLRLRVRTALAAGVAWTLLGPVAVFALTTLGWSFLGRTAVSVDGRLWTSPAPADLLRPGVLLSDLLLTGYYPVLAWGGFLMLGIGLGRAVEAARDRGELPRAAGRMLAAGAAAWGAGAAVWLALPRDESLRVRISTATGVDLQTLRATLLTGEHSLVWLIPDPLWLALAVPHGGGMGEAVRVAGAATALLGLAVLLADRTAAVVPSAVASGPLRERASGRVPLRERASGRVPLRVLTAPLEAVGRIPLTLYAGHLMVLAPLADAGLRGPSAVCAEPGWCWNTDVAVLVAWAGCLAVALAFRLCRSRGPLEAGLQAAASAVVGKRGPGPR